MTENPFKKEYWLGTVNPRPLALFRLLFGSVILVDFLSRVSEVTVFLGDEGFAPRHAIAAGAIWELVRTSGARWAVMLLYLAGVLAAAALMAGYRTRFAQAALFLFEAWMTSRNPAFTTGADHLIGVMSFWLLFANTGAVWSIDSARKKERPRTVPAIGLRLLQWQFAVVVFFAGEAKWFAWANGLGIYHAAQLRDWATPLGAALLAWPSICIALNWLVIGFEVATPLLLIPLAPLSPGWCRAAGILAGGSLFTGIVFFVHVGSFSVLMIAALGLFVLPQWLDQLGLGSQPEGGAGAAPAAQLVTDDPALWQRVLGIAALGQLALVLWSLIATRSGLPEGRLVREELEQLNLAYRWKMFVKPAPLSQRWTDQGTLADGSQQDILAAVLPELIAPSPPDVRWAETRDMLAGSDRLRGSVASYACREFNRGARVPLVDLELELHGLPVIDPGNAPQPERLVRTFRHSCESSDQTTTAPPR